MTEIPKPTIKETTVSKNIFEITDQTDTVISCIEGIYSSTKITNKLISNGYKNFTCLSGGIDGICNFCDDIEIFNKIDYFFPHKFDNSKARRIFQETGDSQRKYYQKLEGKKIYVITHNIFLSLNNEITGKFIYGQGVKEIRYFKGEKELEDYLSNGLKLKLNDTDKH